MNREECHICDATFKTKAYLSKHLKGKHVKPALTNISGDKQNASIKQHDDTNVWDNSPKVRVDCDIQPRESAESVKETSENQKWVDTSKTVPDSVQRPGCMQKTGDVCVIIQKDSEAVSQEIIVNNNGKRRHQMFDTLNADEKIEPTFDFGNWFPADAVIKPQDIKCRRMLNKEGGKVSLEFKYEPK